MTEREFIDLIIENEDPMAYIIEESRVYESLALSMGRLLFNSNMDLSEISDPVIQHGWEDAAIAYYYERSEARKWTHFYRLVVSSSQETESPID